MVHLRVQENLPPGTGVYCMSQCVHFNVPDEKFIYLTSSGSTSFNQPPEKDDFALHADTEYCLSGHITSSGPGTLLWLIEYSGTHRLQHYSRILRTGHLTLTWRTHREHRFLVLAIRLKGTGSLTVSELKLAEKLPVLGVAARKWTTCYKWVIMNPAPSDEQQLNWGDYYFGKSLAHHLRTLGQQVETLYHSQWTSPHEADVVLVLRGLYRYTPVSGRSLNLLWLISHPDKVTVEEMNDFDVLCVASRTHAAELKRNLKRPVQPLLQCTDTDIFNTEYALEMAQRHDYIFVGGNYEHGRQSIMWAVDLGLPLKVWGRNWQGFVPAHLIQAERIPNDKLPLLYGRARVTLNDHWADMLRYGYLNNRVLDALACGLPVITDYHPDFESLLPSALLFYTTQVDLARCINRVHFDYSAVKFGVDSVLSAIQTEFSFARRARQLLYLADEYVGEQKTSIDNAN